MARRLGENEKNRLEKGLTFKMGFKNAFGVRDLKTVKMRKFS